MRNINTILILLLLASGVSAQDASTGRADSTVTVPSDTSVTSSADSVETKSGRSDESKQTIAVVVDSVLKAAEKYKSEHKTVSFGLSIGWQSLDNNSNYTDAAINKDGSLLLETIDQNSIVLSGVVIARPFNKTKKFRWLGFLANVNLAKFTQESITIHNQSIEGGLGVAIMVNADFSFFMSYERINGRALRKGLDAKTLRVEISEGADIQAIGVDDTRFFVDDGVSGLKMGFVYLF